MTREYACLNQCPHNRMLRNENSQEKNFRLPQRLIVINLEVRCKHSATLMQRDMQNFCDNQVFFIVDVCYTSWVSIPVLFMRSCHLQTCFHLLKCNIRSFLFHSLSIVVFACTVYRWRCSAIASIAEIFYVARKVRCFEPGILDVCDNAWRVDATWVTACFIFAMHGEGMNANWITVYVLVL